MFGDVVASNVVGYQNAGVNQGYTLATPTFYAIGGEAVDIQSIKPVGDNVPTGSDYLHFLKFQLLDENSAIQDGKTYYWLDYDYIPEEEWDDPFTVYGWYTKASPTSATDGKAVLSITPGTAVYMQCPNEGVSLCFSGEVGNKEVTIGINQGYTLFGNPYPTAVALKDMTPIGANVPTGSDYLHFLKFQFLDENSAIKEGKTYYWLNYDYIPEEEWDDPFTVYGWYTKASPTSATDGKVADAFSMNAGEGVYMQCPNAGVSINVKGLK